MYCCNLFSILASSYKFPSVSTQKGRFFKFGGREPRTQKLVDFLFLLEILFPVNVDKRSAKHARQ